MYLRDLARSLVRRWYLVVVGLIAVAGLCTLVVRFVPPEYEVRANVLLLPSETSSEQGGNPFLMLGGLTQPLDVLISTMDALSTRTALLADAPDADYVVEPDPRSSSPILTVLVTGESEEQATTVMRTVLDGVTATLGDIQDQLGVAENDRVTSMELTIDTEATPNYKTQLRALVAVAAVGVAGVALLTGLIDSVILARQQRQRGAASADDDNPSAATTPAPASEANTPSRRESRVRTRAHPSGGATRSSTPAGEHDTGSRLPQSEPAVVRGRSDS